MTSDAGSRSAGPRGQIAVRFFEKRRRKAWFTKGEEEVCWEQWTLNVTLATPRTESGTSDGVSHDVFVSLTDAIRACKSPESHGDDAVEDRNEHCVYRQHTEGPYPDYHYKRHEPVPISNQH